MKTREHYEKLLADYVAIIPKNAPAYELLEAIQDLISTLEPSRNVYHYHHHALELPKGWRIEERGLHGYAMYDDKGLMWGTVTPTNSGYMAAHGSNLAHTYTKIDAVDVTRYLARTQLDALQYLCKEASKVTVPPRHAYQYYHHHHHAIELPQGWRMDNTGCNMYALYDDKGSMFGTVAPDGLSNYYTLIDGSRYMHRTQLVALQYLAQEAFK